MTADDKVKRLILTMLREGPDGWREEYPAPAHFVDCPEVTVLTVETRHELWFDTGVDAVAFTARLSCPHEGEVEWEWADLGELQDLLEDLDRQNGPPVTS